MPNHPLAEVFGFPADNFSPEAQRVRKNRLCPYNNISPNCTKTSVENPLGVCSVFGSRGEVVITCPVRFRQEWIIATDAAEFFFPPDAAWTALTEVQLTDPAGKSAGNIDVVLISYDSVGRVMDYGALEVQAVYISGNVRTPFEHYMVAPEMRHDMDWRQRNYPRPDYLSSSRKRLGPQLIFKGGILNAWQRKKAVALNVGFYNTLPALEEVDKADADMAWLIYDLQYDTAQNRYNIVRHKTVYTKHHPSWRNMRQHQASEENVFIAYLETLLEKAESE